VGEKLIARELERILDAQVVARKKCLLLDLDNTLWGGVIGEEGVKGIHLSETGEGARYRDFQLRIRELGEMGVILGIVSKNNEADAFEVFERHEHMVLRKSDFAAMKINWSPKAQSIVEGEGLNLLGIWMGASFANENQQTGFGEPGKGAPHGDQTTCFAAHA
jgi:HAD superfamily phosphatase (TIGR01681 family)